MYSPETSIEENMSMSACILRNLEEDMSMFLSILWKLL